MPEFWTTGDDKNWVHDLNVDFFSTEYVWLGRKGCKAYEYGQKSVKGFATQRLLSNYLADGGDPVVQDSSSPRLGHPLLSNVDDYQGDSPLVNAIPSTVFVDADGNFSIHPPRPTTLGHEKYDGISDQFLAQKGSQDFSVNDELPSRPTRSSKFKKQTIVISDDEDEKEELPIPKVVASSHTVNKKPDAEQLSKPLKTNESA